jgi:dTMP kinase
MTSGVLITFEGIEGSGKTTQLDLLARRLASAGLDVVTTREPGGTELGRELRAALLRPAGQPMHPLAELLLYVTDRAQHLIEVIEPALARGALVLCDRYLDATLAYQGHARELGTDLVLSLHRHPPLDRRPTATLLLDVDPADGLARAAERDRRSGLAAKEGRFEREPLDFHERVRRGYLTLARQSGGRIRVVDGRGTPAAVAERIASVLADVVPEAAAR